MKWKHTLEEQLAVTRFELFNMVLANKPPFDFAEKDIVWILNTVPDELIEKCPTTLGYTEIVMGYVGFKLISGLEPEESTRH